MKINAETFIWLAIGLALSFFLGKLSAEGTNKKLLESIKGELEKIHEHIEQANGK